MILTYLIGMVIFCIFVTISTTVKLGKKDNNIKVCISWSELYELFSLPSILGIIFYPIGIVVMIYWCLKENLEEKLNGLGTTTFNIKFKKDKGE